MALPVGQVTPANIDPSPNFRQAIGSTQTQPSIINGLADSLGFFVQAQDTQLLSVTATATSTQNSADQQNTFHKGAVFSFNSVSVAATTTVRFSIQGKDLSNNYYTIASLSLDAQATNSTFNSVIMVYPGINTSPVGGGVTQAVSAVLPGAYRVIASITATASQGGAGLSFNVNQSKIL